ncbi:MAG: glycosyltransferase family 2 protein [Clostridia bacterium]|nr:glycosyltransferase family 2 protein [Clostridia bacterium]
MNFKYKFSVIVPCYNSEKFLKETLDNLLGQTLKEIQIITVNDGSTDSTADIIAEYSANNTNILSLYQENAGVSAARNNGIDHAEGKYTTFLDSDDLFSENALEAMYNALEETGADLGIYRLMRFGYGGTEFNPIVDSLAKDKHIDCYDKRLLWNFLCNKCYRTELLQKSGIRFPSLRYSEDGAFFMQFVYKTQPKITGIYDAVLKYRRLAPEQGYSVSQRIELELVEHFSRSHELIYDAANASFYDKNCDNPEDYLQEILNKNFTALVNEFYRSLWRGDDETVAFIGKKASEIRGKMTSETKKKCSNVIKDIGEPIFSKSEIAKKPFVSVIAKKPSKDFIHTLYAQTMPVFELITAENTDLPKHENITFLTSRSFKKFAKKTAKGKITIILKGNEHLDMRFLKVISLLKRSPKFGILPDFVIKFGALLFLKIKK